MAEIVESTTLVDRLPRWLDMGVNSIFGPAFVRFQRELKLCSDFNRIVHITVDAPKINELYTRVVRELRRLLPYIEIARERHQ